MIKFSTKLTSVALLTGLAIAGPAYADSTPAGVASDVQSVQQDNADINQNKADLAKHRAEKAQDKANDKWGSQAADSVDIGADKVKKSVHETGKDSDTKTLNEDVNSAAQKPAQPTQ